MLNNEARPNPVSGGVGLEDEQAGHRIARTSVRRTRYPESEIVRLRKLVVQAQALVEQMGDQAEARQQEFQLGYKLGFAAGADVGWGRAQLAQDQRDQAQAEAVKAFSRTRTLETHEQIGQVRYPGYTPEQLRTLRAPYRMFMPMDRLCVHCDGHGVIFGGAA